ncbi:hypothetical protein ANN_25236 [Periplaneta americana]|uniref:Tc1-like transposase DDE domain-containing protein n=1 Tax=Periplaneta americana TaxID=6978 RepID=A0ABQ8S0R2_PERAM|nr:hypothetical protein ANN_25236 [Periplaneta americana]
MKVVGDYQRVGYYREDKDLRKLKTIEHWFAMFRLVKTKGRGSDVVGNDCDESLMLAGNEFQSLGRAIVKEDEYEEVRWDGIVSIVSWRERVFRLWWEERLGRDRNLNLEYRRSALYQLRYRDRRRYGIKINANKTKTMAIGRKVKKQKEEKELVEKKLPSEVCTGRIGEREKSSGQKKIQDEFIPQGATVDKILYKEILGRLNNSIRRKRPELWHRKNWLLLHDNAPAHRSILAQEELARQQVTVLPHFPYSPDLAPCDIFSLSPHESAAKTLRQTAVLQLPEIAVSHLPEAAVSELAEAAVSVFPQAVSSVSSDAAVSVLLHAAVRTGFVIVQRYAGKTVQRSGGVKSAKSSGVTVQRCGEVKAVRSGGVTVETCGGVKAVRSGGVTVETGGGVKAVRRGRVTVDT